MFNYYTVIYTVSVHEGRMNHYTACASVVLLSFAFVVFLINFPLFAFLLRFFPCHYFKVCLHLSSCWFVVHLGLFWTFLWVAQLWVDQDRCIRNPFGVHLKSTNGANVLFFHLVPCSNKQSYKQGHVELQVLSELFAPNTN